MDNRTPFHTLELTGNLKTKSGSQIKEWLSPQVQEMHSRMERWDWNKTFEFELPGKSIISEFDDLLKDDQLPDRLPDFGKLILYDSSMLTDFIKGSFLEPYGLIVSKGAKDILQDFNIGKHRFYQLTLTLRGVDHDNYYFFRSLTNSNKYIDIKNSSFRTQKGFFKTDDTNTVNFKDFMEITEFRQAHSKDNIHIFADKIKMTSDFPQFDFFTLLEFALYETVVSNRLADKLRVLTGINLEPTEKIEL